jgi:cobalt-zinc-cadmium efflux system outer membrane protein
METSMQRRPLLFGLVAAVLASAPAHSQSLRDALEGAWRRQPAAQAIGAREDELAARREAAAALLPEPPSINVGYRTDRLNQNAGDRELEGALSLPLWIPGTRDAAQALARAESEQFDSGLRAQRWRLAGEVRDVYWQARLAAIELELAQRKVEETVALAADVERRVKAGELARADLNQARGAEQLARVVMAEARVRNFRAVQAFTVLTGMKTIPEVAEAIATAPSDPESHPQLTAAERVVSATRARLGQATVATRDVPEIEIGMRRERSAFGEAYANSVIIGVKVPFATDARNRPRITAANADLIEATAALVLERRKLVADIDGAVVELEQVREAENLAAERFRLAADTQALLAKAFALGELDLPARLRAENERFDAERALTRARIEVGRAISRLNQARGVLP